MRTHTEIVKSLGATKLQSVLADYGHQLTVSAVQRWADRNSIPAPFWKSISELKVATLEELATAVAEAA